MCLTGSVLTVEQQCLGGANTVCFANFDYEKLLLDQPTITKGGRMKGKVIKLVLERRFGFIEGEDGKEYFFHKDDLNGFFEDLAEDMMKGRKVDVTFTIVPSPKGPRAAEVTRVDGGV
jgi:cold shock CspA family protein